MKKFLRHLQSWSGCYCVLLLILVIVILLGKQNTDNNTHCQNGRYQVASNSGGICWVIDTETSQLWMRNTRGGYDLGTNSKPYEVRARPLKLTEISVWDEAERLNGKH